MLGSMRSFINVKNARMVMVMVKSLGNTFAFVPMYQPKFGNDVSFVRQGFMLQIDMGSIH